MNGIDIVVSNAGIVRPTQPRKDSYERAIQDFDDVINVNLRGVYLTGRAAIPHMLATGGDIVNITTDHIHTCGWPEHLDHTDAQECPWKDVQRPPVGSKNFDIYDSSKWGIKGITNAWARDLAPHKIRVNSFGMGATITPMFLSVLGDRPIPSGTMQANDVAGLIVELIAEGPDGRTGDDVQVWAGHPTVLPPIGLEGRLTLSDLVGKN
jgi:NAD(P)-dependent dehydrogenase (short-subunit alcohol dehydrogenase family)